MNEGEIERLRGVLADLKASGVTVVVVEHNLLFVSRTCEVVTVLDGGRVVVDGTLDEVLAHADVIRAYLGESTAAARDLGTRGGEASRATAGAPSEIGPTGLAPRG
jgi:ABC-type sugar transport system ATPase subunit